MTGGGVPPAGWLRRRAREGAPGLAPPPGAAGSEPARPELARGTEQGGRGRPEEGPGGREGIPRAAGGSLAPRSGAHKRQRRAPARGLLGRRRVPDGVKDRGPLGAGFALGPLALPGLGIRLPDKGRGRQTEARGGKRLASRLAWRLRPQMLLVLVEPRCLCPGAGPFHCWAVPSRPQPACSSPP